MVDSNIHREHILPSEKAFAYKMKSEALKHQGKTSCQLGTKSRTDEDLALFHEFGIMSLINVYGQHFQFQFWIA